MQDLITSRSEMDVGFGFLRILAAIYDKNNMHQLPSSHGSEDKFGNRFGIGLKSQAKLNIENAAARISDLCLLHSCKMFQKTLHGRTSGHSRVSWLRITEAAAGVRKLHTL